MAAKTFQDVILTLQNFWAERGCVIAQPWDVEKGAGTYNASTFLRALGIDPLAHDLRLVEDDWEQPTLGAWGLGWEIWIDGMEATQFTYFQQVGGIELDPVPAEITYGLERICMFLQDVDNGYDMAWAPGISYGQIRHQEEVEFSHFNFEEADTTLHARWFDEF